MTQSSFASAGSTSAQQPAQAGQIDDLVVSERPALAPNIRPVGELQGSGFEDRQWLIERDGHFIQVTELLYRVIEHANGERTREEIAAVVTEESEWEITADQVHYLIENRLVPLGLIAQPDEQDLSMTRSRTGSRGGSPLTVNLKMRMLGPRFIDPVTSVLQFLFAPPILVAVLLLTIAAHAWLYLEHGFVDSLRMLLYIPGLTYVALGIVLVAAVFHEFGHAAALRYGGGQVRGMGAGIYLIYPILYTDVTDSYRLGRWGRVRTDLGGIYFHLIFALGLIGLVLVSGWEFLFIVVLLINLEILRQFIPFARLDGYWALADLTGIPDFFSQIGPFVRSLLPGDRVEGSRLPNLKRWVKWVFALYILVTIPALGYFFFTLLTAMPNLLATSWDALAVQLGAISHALEDGYLAGLLAPAGQSLLLALPVLLSVYMLYTLARAALQALWSWGKPTAGRRVARTLIAMTAVGVLAVLWTPGFQAAGRVAPAGVQEYTVRARNHVQGRVVYTQNPPVGGDHAPIWQNCGFYDTPIANENAVHSMEHGAVWITYRPDLPAADVDALRSLARRQTYVIVSPYPDLGAPVVASAWGRQLKLDSVSDPRLSQFVQAFWLGKQAPERGGPCTRGIGVPK